MISDLKGSTLQEALDLSTKGNELVMSNAEEEGTIRITLETKFAKVANNCIIKQGNYAEGMHYMSHQKKVYNFTALAEIISQ